MKRPLALAILPPLDPPVLAKNANSQYFYGVEIDPTDRGFITTEKYETTYVVRSIDNLTDGNGWDSGPYRANSLRELIEQLLREDAPVFQFETFQELTAWITENLS